MLNPEQILLDKYEIIKLLGEGAFGRVYLARERLTGREVAINELREDLPSERAAEARQRFEREIQIGAGLDHPRVVKIITHEKQGSEVYLVQEYLPGGSLRTRLNNRPLAVDEAVHIACDIAEALAYVHEHPLDLVHRDISPNNILLDAEGRAKLGDFGIVQSPQHSTTRWQGGSEGHPGNAHYRAPEALRTEPLRPSADVYMLGAVLWEMLTGRTYKQQEPNTLPRQLRSEVPPALETIIMRALDETPARRYRNGRDFLTALQRFEQTRAKASRNQKRFMQIALWIGGLTLLLVMTGLGVTLGMNALRATLTPGTMPVLVSVPTQTPKPAFTATSAPAAVATLTHTPNAIPTQTLSPTATPAAKHTPSATYIPTPRPSALGDTRTRPADGMIMVYVPAGNFQMGSSTGDNNVQPTHSVTLDGFWLDRTEITVAHFKRFVAATGYRTEVEKEGKSWVFTGNTWEEVAGANWAYPRGTEEPAPDNHPVVHITWPDAAAYCVWAGGRLPTEAEWEYAARSPQGYAFPWGNDFQGRRLNFCDQNCSLGWADQSVNDGHRYAAPAGSFPDGASWAGALDMAGNVWEWVADWYGPYSAEREVNPVGPPSGEYKILRGGSWDLGVDFVRSFTRARDVPSSKSDSVGFRCALTQTP